MLTPEQARARNEARKNKVREDERRCRGLFRTTPDGHAERCICSPTCSRDYDPAPPDDALEEDGDVWAPQPRQVYEGTGIGALYGLLLPEGLASGLAGWNIKPGSEPE